MGAALEVITGFVTAPDTTLTTVTMGAGNSATVRQGVENKRISLLELWGDNQTAGILRITSPKLHDAVQGIRLRVSAALAAPLLPWGPPQKLFPNDPLTIQVSGSATAGDIETFGGLVYYEDLPGVAGRFITADQLYQRIVNVFTVENTIATGTAGGWSGEEAINAEFDLGKANTDYALVGYYVSAQAAAIRYRGADTGNLGVGGPGEVTLRHLTAEWFLRLSLRFGLPLIPVFNWTNRAGILIDAAQDENGADPIVTSIFAELAPAGGR